MVYYLPSSSTSDEDGGQPQPSMEVIQAETMADLRVFWGPEICRLEYLMHLVETGRIKDEVAAP